MELMDLGFGEPEKYNHQDAPPWEVSEKDIAPQVFKDEGSPTGGSSLSSDDVSETELGDEEELEIYQKARRFDAIKLLSGNDFTETELSDYVAANYGKLGQQRLKMAKFIMVSLGYKPSPDVLLMLSCTRRARIVIATAGAGKTTSLQFDLLISKMLDKALGLNLLRPELIEGTSVSVPKILYLNYNKHNVQPIEDRHKSLCKAVNKLFKEDDAIEDSIDSSTVHAFCHRWLKAFSFDIEIPELNIITEDNKEQMWTAIMTPRWKKFYDGDDCDIEYTVLDELYNFKVESMLDWDDFFLTAKFVDSGLRSDFAKACIKKYDSMKKQMGLMDFTDYLILMTKVLRENPQLRRKLQERYRIIIADENQDFTRLMNELLIQLYDPAVNQLVIVGDPDQTIYAFKGVSPDNVVTLSESLQDVEVLGLDTNYRCPDKIVDAAKAILNLNVLRFEKPINTVRTGGVILSHPINQGEFQEQKVLQLLERIGSSNYGNTVITYRNNSSSVIIAEELYYSGIPFTILDDRRPFSNSVFRQVTNALKALRDKDDFNLNIGLYRFIPLKKEEWVSILEMNREQRRNHLHDLIVPHGLPNGTMEALKVLIRISELIDTQPTCDYIAALIKLYRTYYLDYMMRAEGPWGQDTDMLALYLERTVKFYSRQMTFDYMMSELREKNRDNPAGVVLSTFHGLKGLEFDYVIAIDFMESIFPNYFSIEQRYSRNTAMEEKESENRLCYVLVTRTIKEFHMFYLATDPSVYAGILLQLDNPDAPIAGEPTEELSLGSVAGPSGMDSKMNFIQRLIGERG